MRQQMQLCLISALVLMSVVSFAATCPPTPSYGPNVATLVETGTNANGHGLAAANHSVVNMNFLAAGNNPNRMISQTHLEQERFEQVLSAPAGCLYTVTYYFDAEALAYALTDEDDWIDDLATAGAVAVLSPGGGQLVVAASGATGSDSASGTLTTSTRTATCVPSGTIFACQASTSAYGQIVSEAFAFGYGHYDDPVFHSQEILCDE